jgi:hypothetical protein
MWFYCRDGNWPSCILLAQLPAPYFRDLISQNRCKFVKCQLCPTSFQWVDQDSDKIQRPWFTEFVVLEVHDAEENNVIIQGGSNQPIREPMKSETTARRKFRCFPTYFSATWKGFGEATQNQAGKYYDLPYYVIYK